MRAVVALFLTPGVLAASPTTFDLTRGGNAAGHPTYESTSGFGFEPGPPTSFSVRVPEGNYRVTLGFDRGSDVVIYAEQRRLYGSGSRSFIVNVRTPALGDLPANATGGTAVRLKPREIGAANWDDKLTLEFSPDASAPKSIAIEPADVPTITSAVRASQTPDRAVRTPAWKAIPEIPPPPSTKPTRKRVLISNRPS